MPNLIPNQPYGSDLAGSEPHGHDDDHLSIAAAATRTALVGRWQSRWRHAASRAAVSVVVASVALWASTAIASASDPVPAPTWATNGSVDAVVPGTNGIAYLTGRFSEVAPTTGAIAAFDTTTGTVQPGWPEVVGVVNALAPDGSGGWFLGGLFTSVGGVPRENLAHILADKTLDSTWNVTADGPVNALAVGGSALYVGGQFQTIDSQARTGVAAVDASTAALQSFAPQPTATSGTADVASLIVSGSTLYVGGYFATIGSAARSDLAAIDTTTSLATTWAPNPDGFISAMALSGSTLYVSGAFDSVAGVARGGMAALDTSTGNATGWTPSTTSFGNAGSVVTLAVDGGSVYIGGQFDKVGGLARPGIGAVNTTNGQPTAWAPAVSTKCFDSDVESMLVTATTVYAGDACIGDGLGPKTNFVAFDRTTAATTAFSADTNDVPLALGISGSTIVAGGVFTSAGPWESRDNLAAIDAATGAATSWNPALTGTLEAVTVGGGSVFAAITTDSWANTRIVRIDPSTGAVTDLGLDVTGSQGGFVEALATDGSTVYIAGQFTSVNGVARLDLASVSALTGSLTTWNPGASGPAGDDGVISIATAGSTVYVTGKFTSLGGQPRTEVAAIDATTGVPTSWNPQLTNAGAPIAPPNYPPTILLSGGRIFLMGPFDSVDGQPRPNLASFDGTTGSLTTWAPARRGYSLSAPDSPIFGAGGLDEPMIAVGGGVAYLLEASADGTGYDISGFDAVTGVRTSWEAPLVPDFAGQYFQNAQQEGGLISISVGDGMLFEAGGFMHMNGQNSSNFARFAVTGATDTQAAPASSVPPAITGPATVGGSLSCSTGTWSGDPLPTFTFEWLRDGSPIAGETTASHLVNADDGGHGLACRVTAANSAGHASATSSVVAVAATSNPTPHGPAPPIVTCCDVPKGGGPQVNDARVKAAVAIVTRTLGKAGALQLKVTCPAAANGSCSGSFGLATAKAVKAAKGAKAKVATLGRATFRVAAGKTAKAQITLSKSARQLLGRFGSVSVRLTTTTRVAGASTASVATTTFTLHAHR